MEKWHWKGVLSDILTAYSSYIILLIKFWILLTRVCKYDESIIFIWFRKLTPDVLHNIVNNMTHYRENRRTDTRVCSIDKATRSRRKRGNIEYLYIFSPLFSFLFTLNTYTLGGFYKYYPPWPGGNPVELFSIHGGVVDEIPLLISKLMVFI